MQVAALAGTLYHDSFTGPLTPSHTFTTSATVVLIAYPLMANIQKYPLVESTLQCLHRLQAHLLLQELQNVAVAGSYASTSTSQHTAETSEPQDKRKSIELAGAYLSPSGRVEPVLNNVTCSVKRSQITAILGSVGSGKTTLLRAMLGEAAVHYGQVFRRDCNIAYCGQKPWLRSVSIRKNIIGLSAFDPVWYEVVLNACALNQDFRQLPKGDSTKVGINGVNLSGGQRHRIVSS